MWIHRPSVLAVCSHPAVSWAAVRVGVRTSRCAWRCMLGCEKGCEEEVAAWRGVSCTLSNCSVKPGSRLTCFTSVYFSVQPLNSQSSLLQKCRHSSCTIFFPTFHPSLLKMASFPSEWHWVWRGYYEMLGSLYIVENTPHMNAMSAACDVLSEPRFSCNSILETSTETCLGVRFSVIFMHIKTWFTHDHK
jgi:hypothetical protein